MKRLHVHVSAEDVGRSVAFYTALFGTPPTTVRDDYAKWMLDDPRVNFAVSKSGSPPGIDHLGIQVDSAEELRELEDRIRSTEAHAIESEAIHCCYANVHQGWGADPQGVFWEAFLTLGEASVYCDGRKPWEDLERQIAEAGAGPAGKA